MKYVKIVTIVIISYLVNVTFFLNIIHSDYYKGFSKYIGIRDLEVFVYLLFYYFINFILIKLIFEKRSGLFSFLILILSDITFYFFLYLFSLINSSLDNITHGVEDLIDAFLLVRELYFIFFIGIVYIYIESRSLKHK